MDREQAEALVRCLADEAVEQGTADLTSEERAELDANWESYREAKAEWQRREQVVVDEVQRRQQAYGAAWEQVFRAATSAGSESPTTRPVEIAWRDPERRA